MTSLPAFVAASLVLILLPGPNLLYIVMRSVHEGRRAGVVSALGVETGTLVHVLAASLGLASLVSQSPAAFAVLRYAGAGYLAWLGVRTLTSRTDAAAAGAAPAAAGPARIYRDGVLVNLLNPKVILFFVAFLPQFLPSGLGTGAARARMLGLGTVFLFIALALDLCYAFAGAALSARLRSAGVRLKYPAAAVYLLLATAAATGAL
ncbi:LysE family translocator [Streptomyces sp. CB01881]|uniref:LysE family translocator n=1 Tax=Streptomyces sp. CB01881 TaxID=2078691 RepID=UPI000CDBF060|nr:LysE family translocator [Streptomyces sp. CB01881]AUY50944.1 LysE family translocator [Streptomyces sp. CB01881]TYC74329.1 LysE family translocator [Streptomyces sp. CB01881]